jgi:protein TonB
MSTQDLDIMGEEMTFDEVVFDGRNKNFGGYYLRVSYVKNVKYALIIAGFAFVLLAVSGYLYYLNQGEDLVEEVSYEVDMEALESTPVDQEEKKEELPPPPPPKQEIKMEIVKFVPPVVKIDNKVINEEPLKNNEDLENSETGKENQDGQKGLNSLANNGSENGQLGGTGKEEEEVFSFVPVKPKFKGDDTDAEVIKYLQNRIIYPEAAKQKKIEGVVYIEFVINSDGKVTKAKVLRGVNPALDAEALKYVQKLPDWDPGMNNGTPVSVKKVLPVRFKLQ